MKIYYNSHDLKCKTPFGAVSDSETVSFSVFCEDGTFIDRAVARIYLDGEDDYEDYPLEYKSTEKGYSEFSGSVNDLGVGLYWYHFVFYTENGEIEYKNNGYGFQLTVYDSEYYTPDYIKGGVIYHIFVDRFNKGNDPKVEFKKDGVLKEWHDPLTIRDPDGVYRANDFYGGNFQGIIDKLDYLKELNVTLIYLSPIFKSSSNHRYDTGDYNELDELLGNEKKFKELIDKAEEKGMSIMLDGVFNHTGADSVYFNKFNHYDSIGAFQSQTSPYYNWYTFYDFPNNYHCWWGVTVCPTISPVPNGFRDLITNPVNGIINKWTKMGVKGWRLDVVDELQEIFVKDIRKAIKRNNKNALMIGEVWEDASNKIAYDYRRHYFQGEELDGVMNYVFKVATLDYVLYGNVQAFKEKVDSIIENYPKQSLDVSMNLIGSHDTIRVLTMLGCPTGAPYTKEERMYYSLSKENYDLAVKRLKVAAAIQYILPGVPSVYYGDEIGMQGFEDPLNRQPMTWDNINKELLTHYRTLGKIRADYKDEVVGTTNIEENKLLIINRIGKKRLTLVANTLQELGVYKIKENTVDLLSGKHFEKGNLIVNTNDVYILVFKE